MSQLFDLVGFTTTTTGTGTITVAAALSGHRTMAGASIADGTVVSYGISSNGGADRETGTGTVGASGTTLTRTLSASSTGSLLNLSGTSEVYITPIASDFPMEVATFANLPDPATVTAGRVHTVLGAIVSGGNLGTQWVSDGTVWRPNGPQNVLISVTDYAGLSGGSTAEEILAQVQFPALCLSGCREIQIRTRYLWSGTETNARSVRIRLGTAGTTSDTAVCAITNVGNTVRHWLLPVFLLPRSATSIRYWGVSGTALSQLVTPDSAASNVNRASDLTVPNLTGALWMSFTHQSGASPTATATLSAVSIVLS